MNGERREAHLVPSEVLSPGAQAQYGADPDLLGIDRSQRERHLVDRSAIFAEGADLSRALRANT
jgi:hypothetical protein